MSISIVGAGINGLLSAFLISEKYPDTHIGIYDAEDRPDSTIRHGGVTHGSKDARHITGSESIGFESSVHKDALRNSPSHQMPGWLLKDDASLSDKEKEWRQKFESSYISSDGLNELDFDHAELNYKGLAAWQVLAQKYSFIRKQMINVDGVDVYFRNEAAFEDDVEMETEFCTRYFKQGQVKQAQNWQFDNLFSKKLVVPGISIRVKSLAAELLQRLEANPNVHFHWDTVIEKVTQLEADTVVWTAGVTHKQPEEYKELNVQGIVGCWMTIPNQNFQRPFKIATPTPSAYINFTPDNHELHISGGFGWTGEYAVASKVKEVAKPMVGHFISQINKYLGTNIKAENVDLCVRSSTPTGKPLLLVTRSRGKKHIFITGSAKSGTTHAPILSEYVLEQIA